MDKIDPMDGATEPLRMKPGKATSGAAGRFFLSLFLVALLCACASGPRNRVALLPQAHGLRADTWPALDAALEKANRERAVPAAVLSVGRDGRVIYERAIGIARTDGKLAPATRGTLFDVASLAKPVTAAAVLLAAQEGLLALDEPAWPGGPSHEQLLFHLGGMPQNTDWRSLDASEPLLAQWAALEDRDGRGSYLYSNVGYLALAASLEERAGEPLGARVGALLRGLGIDEHAITWRPAPGAAVAATSRDVAPGEPFDPLAAWVVKSRAPAGPGHSGLFATAGAMNQLAQAMLFPQTHEASVPGWTATARQLAGPAREVRGFTRRDGVTVTHEVAWRTAGLQATGPAGERFHTGYTGCVMWMDPARGLSYVLLTNSVHGPSDDGWRGLDEAVRAALLRGDTRSPQDGDAP